MKISLKKPDKTDVLKIIAIYAIFSSLWIYLSDTVLGLLIKDPATLIRISVFKGFFFVAITSFLLYQLVSRYLLESRQLKELVKKNELLFSLLAERTADLEKNRTELERQNEELRETSQALVAETAALQRAMEGVGSAIDFLASESFIACNRLIL